MVKLCISILLCCYLIISGQDVLAGHVTISGKVTRVIDGDSIILERKGTSYEIRLWGIDSPEYDQPYASAARKTCNRLIGKKTVTVVIKDRDSYGRFVGVIRRGKNIINEELVRKGAAWVYSRYCKESVCKKWKKLEKNARRSGTGLWKYKNAIQPWEWRKKSR